VALGPAVTAIDTIAPAGYVKVHCSAAGSLPAGDVKVRFKGVLTPEGVAPEDNTREPACATAGLIISAARTRALSMCREILRAQKGHLTRFLLLRRALMIDRVQSII
jgi:hypothetical protein